MGFQDVLKKSFLEGFASADLSTTSILISLTVTAAIGIYIFAVYRIAARRNFYSKSFNISLVALAVITAAVILTIQSSVVISLGMVGALSIVRFRTAVKDPQDLVFLFWSISTGIICGAGLFEVAAIMAALVTIVILLLELLPVRKESMLLIVNAQDCDVEEKLKEAVSKYAGSYQVKSRNLTVNGMDLVMELRVKDGGSLVKEVGALEKVRSVSLLSHDGEVTY
ncbi:MAG: DUF4956 domain-containing protein [Lachnospiraceae bacterium]|nr:DUF4956 domain-containing protein [Lachnospiraceae bacterium]